LLLNSPAMPIRSSFFEKIILTVLFSEYTNFKSELIFFEMKLFNYAALILCWIFPKSVF